MCEEKCFVMTRAIVEPRPVSDRANGIPLYFLCFRHNLLFVDLVKVVLRRSFPRAGEREVHVRA